jgi:alpha-tubulin suppressor-like RCC1 family protein
VINQISCGAYHTLALSNYGDVYAWGKGFEGQLGIRKGLECCSSPQLLVKFYKYDDG